MDQEPASPPDDADEWTNEQWIEWLKATDASVDEETETAEPVTAGSRVAHSTGGQLLGNAMMGLANALYGKQPEEPAIIVEAGEPEGEGFELHLDYEHPERSTATRRHGSGEAEDSETDEV